MAEADADRRGASGTRVRGVANQVDEEVIERVRVPFQINRLECGVELERNPLFLQHAALERAAGADHPNRVEPLGSRQRSARAILDRPEKSDRAIDVLDDLPELVEQLEPPVGRHLRPATQRLHGELQAGARPGEGIGQLVGDDAGQRADVLKRVGPHWPRLVRPHFPAVEEPEAQPGELEREALAAAPLAALRGWRGRPGAHRRDHPGPGRRPAPDPAAPLDDGNVPALQRGIDVQLGGVMGRRGVARALRLELGARGHLPYRNGTAAEGHARLPQDLAPAVDE